MSLLRSVVSSANRPHRSSAARSPAIQPRANMRATADHYALMIVVCVFATNARPSHAHRLYRLITVTTVVNAFVYNPITSSRPVQNRLENIDVKGLLDTLNKLSRTKSLANTAVSDGRTVAISITSRSSYRPDYRRALVVP